MSPEVWNEMKPLIASVAAAHGVTVTWPNEDVNGLMPDPPAMWMAFDLAADTASKYELGADVWLENGSLWLHLFLPGGVGIETGLAVRKAFSVAFRSAQPSLDGLSYFGHSFEPLGPDDGIYKRLSLVIRYGFNDIVT